MRALVLSGGGVRGAFQAGALLAEVNRNPSLDYQVIAGVSAGAINASGLATHAHKEGGFAQGVKTLQELWLSIEGSHSIYQRRFWGWLAGYFKKGLYSTKPLKNLLEHHVDPKAIRMSERQLRIGVWNVTTDQYFEVSENQNDLVSWILASASIPVILEPVHIKDIVYADGGVRNNVPQGFLEEDDFKFDAIDIFLTSPFSPALGQPIRIKTIKEIGSRLVEALTSEIFYNDLFPFIHYKIKNPKTKIRIFAPPSVFTKNPVSFEPDYIQYLINMGAKTRPIELNVGMFLPLPEVKAIEGS